MNKIILLYVVAHFLGDFVFQSDQVIELRFSKEKRDRWIGNIRHMSIHLVIIIVLYVLLFGYTKYPIRIFIITTLGIVVSHMVIDVIKSELKARGKLRDKVRGLTLFIADQFLHVLLIILITARFRADVITSAIHTLYKSYPNNLDTIDKFLVVCIIVIITTFAVGTLIKMLFEDNQELEPLDQLEGNNESYDKGMKHGGLLIGYMERLFIMLVVAIGQPSMVGFVLATKTIVRFKKLDKDVFAEYFIIGTLISFLFALIGGLLIYTLKIIPVVK